MANTGARGEVSTVTVLKICAFIFAKDKQNSLDNFFLTGEKSKRKNIAYKILYRDIIVFKKD